MRSALPIIAIASLLSGCAGAMLAPLAVSVVGGEALSEKISDGIGLELTGESLGSMANWRERYPQKTVSIFGRSDWVCARSTVGNAYCIPPEQAHPANINRKAIFRCRFGQGGMIASMLINKSSTTSYCEGVEGTVTNAPPGAIATGETAVAASSTGPSQAKYQTAEGPKADKPTIRKAQAFLNAAGYGPLSTDGSYGPKTRQAVMNYQNDKKLEPTGVLDEATLAAMRTSSLIESEQTAQPSREPPKAQRGVSDL